MRKTVIFLVLAGLGIWSIVQASGVDARVLQDHGSSITLEFQLNDYTIEPTQINGNTYSKVLIQGQPPLLEKGMPELPIFVSSIIIPNDAHMDYRIIDIEYETIKIDPVVSSKGNLYRNINPADIPYTFAKFYQTNIWWPEKTIELDRPFILRDYRGLSVRFNPFQFNPATKELKIAKRVIIEVYEMGKSSINVLTEAKNIAAREFVNIYDDFFLNFRQARYDSISERAGRMVIICADAFMSNMETFKTWKRMKGIDTKLVPISSIGNNETAIKNFIQNEYNAGDLVWVLLVGDGNEIVPATGNMGSASGADADPVYAYTSGGDYYPDLFISRFSSRSGTAANIDKQASRSIGYEQTPETGANWYHVGLGVASNQGSPPDYERCNWLRDSLLLYYYTSVDSSYDSWGTSAIIKSKIEAGTGIINYIGHGGTTGWLNGGGFSISDINSLNNPWLLPFVLSVACLVGNFNGSDCYCEASVTAGTVSDPDGFLVHWGSSINQSWVPPCFGQEGADNLLTHDKKNTFGGICFNGACYMIEYYGASSATGIEMAQTWHIFGDASVQLRTDTPGSMTVNHAAAIFLGQTTFDVSVPGVQNALVGLYIDTLLVGHGYTNPSGNVTITLNPPPSSPGTMYITVTAYNRIPYLGSVPITSSAGPYIALGAQIIDDASGGNNDGVVNPGETIDYGIYGENVGTSTAFNVYGLLSETDPYVSLSIDSSWYGNIAADDSSLSNPYYQFTVAANCPNDHAVSFPMEFHDTNDTVW
ncbi:MAG: C25 family cysteine peptidase, partial [bacterium]